MMQGKFAFNLLAAVTQKTLQVAAFDQPGPLTGVSDQTFFLDPADYRLAVFAERLSRLPDRVDAVRLDPVWCGCSGHQTGSGGSGPEVFWHSCAASYASTSSSR